MQCAWYTLDKLKTIISKLTKSKQVSLNELGLWFQINPFKLI